MTTPLATRGALAFAGAVLAGCISSTVFAVALNHSSLAYSLVANLTAIPLFIAGLGVGITGALIAGAAGIIDLLIREPSNAAVLYFILFAAPTLLVTLLALRRRATADGRVFWYPLTNILMFLVIYPASLFLALCFAASGHEGGLLQITVENMTGFFAGVKHYVAHDAIDQADQAQQIITRYLPSMVSGSWMLVMFVSILISQSAVQQHKWNMRSSLLFQELEAPHWLITVVALTGLLAVFTAEPYSYVLKNLAIILGLPFVLVGLAIIHSWIARQSFQWALLALSYFAILVLPGVVLIVALFGMVDQWAHFRQRFVKQPKTT